MNCDCTEIERRQFAGIAEQAASLRLTDEERAAIEEAADFIDAKSYASSDTLRSLLDRTK
jgi:hypothetical protein